LRAVETNKSQARDHSQASLVEARMRAENMLMTSNRDQTLESLHESNRRLTLLEEELAQIKTKLSKTLQEKMQLERDQRATLSLAKSLQGNVNSDVDYYKRKVLLAQRPFSNFQSIHLD
jgi:hypothetical protein